MNHYHYLRRYRLRHRHHYYRLRRHAAIQRKVLAKGANGDKLFPRGTYHDHDGVFFIYISSWSPYHDHDGVSVIQ